MAGEDGSYTLDFSWAFLGWSFDSNTSTWKQNPIATAVIQAPPEPTATTTTTVNKISVAILPPAPVVADAPTVANPNPTIALVTVATSVDLAAQAIYGEQATPIIVTLLETLIDAFALTNYILRAVPVFWFSNISVILGGMSNADQTIMAELEIGNQLSISKVFPNVAGTTTKTSFLEGIEHEITPSGHEVTLSTGPAVLYRIFTLDSPTLGVLDNELLGLG